MARGAQCRARKAWRRVVNVLISYLRRGFGLLRWSDVLELHGVGSDGGLPALCDEALEARPSFRANTWVWSLARERWEILEDPQP